MEYLEHVLEYRFCCSGVRLGALTLVFHPACGNKQVQTIPLEPTTNSTWGVSVHVVKSPLVFTDTSWAGLSLRPSHAHLPGSGIP
jgi:hypothetical protein